ncbi:MAG: shikimate dehydrogenase [Betaproteobacteria bacterium]|nr:MAG: shikimate dehydrogenase [Betaproteobacteria bacterium]
MAHPDRFLLAGVMGWPVMHSRSPMLHNYWFKQHGLAGSYVPLAIRPEHLTAALRGLHPLGFAGVNVTIPHKQEAMKIVNEHDGSLTGTNNDCYGFIHAVRQEHPGWRPDAGPIVVIGAGGGSRAVCYGLAQEGAKEIRLVNRTLARAKAIAGEFRGPIKALPWEQRHDALEGAAMVVNTTSQGMVGNPALDITLDKLPQGALAADIIYIPLETPFLAAARKRGNRTINGLGMLLNQGRPAWKAWFGIEPEVTVELRAMVERTI